MSQDQPLRGDRSIFPANNRSVPGPAGPAPIRALSVVVPVCDEEDNIVPLALEVRDALRGRYDFELIYVDDGSTDGTAEAARRVRAESVPELRLLRHAQRSGQSAAVATGVRAASHGWIATLDGDGQNDPADIPRLVEFLTSEEGADLKLVMGNRSVRQDSWLRRLSSRVANGVRGRMLRDETPDTGCGIKVFDKATFMDLPQFDHMHRFLPALFQRAGARVASVPVSHRPRTRGDSKYGLFDRLWVGITDLFGMMWLIRRATRTGGVREE